MTEMEYIHLLRRQVPTALWLFILYAAPSQKMRVSQEMTQFVLKIAHLATLIEPIPLLEKVSSYGLSYPDLLLKQLTLFAKSEAKPDLLLN